MLSGKHGNLQLIIRRADGETENNMETNSEIKRYPTPHIDAVPGDFAETVLMPGDPLRSRYIAEHYLDGARLVNDVRGVQGYTGTFCGVPVSVMASGMGIPSIGIYSYELYTVFGVKNIIRVGSAGAIGDEVKLRDVVIAQGASTDSAFASQYRLPGTFAPICSYRLLRAAADCAEDMGIGCCVGNVLSSDVFYNDDFGVPEEMCSVRAFGRMGVLAVEMEAAGLYMTAARCGGNALAVCTVTDSLRTGERLSSDERQRGLDAMIRLALGTAVDVSGRAANGN